MTEPCLSDLAASAEELLAMFYSQGTGFQALRGLWAEQLQQILTEFPKLVDDAQAHRKRSAQAEADRITAAEPVDTSPDRCAQTVSIRGRTKRCTRPAGHGTKHSVHIDGRNRHEF